MKNMNQKQERLRALKTLTDTNKFLTKDTWIKGTMNAGSRYCLLGALRLFRTRDITFQSFDYAEVAIRQVMPKAYKGSIPRFNDSKSTTLKKVKSVLSKAIRRVKTVKNLTDLIS